MSEDRLKIAVFIDFDNIEIGVKSTLNRNFDIAAVLEAIKERGEIVTKVAYGDWKRSGDYGRAMGQHAIHMVQRNLTPGGDKNGADINLALDALEMAFTRDHINAFVIVGGDSDFMTLVEKLKQYDKKVFVVGGRAFTSAILQKNCHEFIAYENLIRPGRRQSGRTRSGAEVSLDKAVPLVLRALKILTDREVSPQIGLLKSTLLQLDSTFTERDYGATSFRDFVEKLARTGVISLKHMDRSIVVEPRDGAASESSDDDRKSRSRSDSASPGAASEPLSVSPEKMEEGVQRIRAAFEGAEGPLKWPMYLRSVRQLIKAADPDFDESEYGFRGLQDALRAVQKAGVLRLERNRQGVLRMFPGESLPGESGGGGGESDADGGPAPEADAGPDAGSAPEQSASDEGTETMESPAPSDDVDAPPAATRKTKARKTTARRKTTTTRKTGATRASKTTKAAKTTKTGKAVRKKSKTTGSTRATKASGARATAEPGGSRKKAAKKAAEATPVSDTGDAAD